MLIFFENAGNAYVWAENFHWACKKNKIAVAFFI